MPTFSDFLTLTLILFSCYQMARMFMLIDETSDPDYNMDYNWLGNSDDKEPMEPAATIIDVPTIDNNNNDNVPGDRKTGKNYFPLHVLVCLPDNKYENKSTNYFKMSSLAAKPVIDVAYRSVIKRGILPMGALDIVYKDSNLSDVYGPWWPIEALLRNQLDCIMGYATNYELGPVARSSWLYKNRQGVPVLTTIGLVDVLDNRDIYKMLFRMSGSYSRMAQFLLDFIHTHNWDRFLYLYQDNIVKDTYLGKHECYHQAVALYRQEVRMTHRHKKTVARNVDPNLLAYNYTQLLIELSMESNSK